MKQKEFTGSMIYKGRIVIFTKDAIYISKKKTDKIKGLNKQKIQT